MDSNTERYKCSDCGDLFDEVKIITEYTGVRAPDGTLESYDMAVCPYCGSEVVERVQVCALCEEEEVSRYKFSKFCDECLEELKNELSKAVSNLARAYKVDADTIEEALYEIYIEK